MIARISEIPDEGLQVDSLADLGAVFPEAGWTLDAVGLHIERRDGDVVVTGSFRATARLQCSRCLEPLVTRAAARGRDFSRGDTLVVGGLLRSGMALALPMKPLCRADCPGLCPVCGANRNVTACVCEVRSVDPRLAPLEALRRPH